MTDNADRSRRRRFLHLIGTVAAAGLAGCNAGDDSDADPATTSAPTETPPGTGTTTGEQTPPDTGTPPDAEPPTETETGTGTETPTEEEPSPETSTPEPDLTFDEIYQEEMFHEEGVQGVERNWDWIESQLREDGHDLSNTENMTGDELSRLMEDVAGHAGSYAGIYGAAAAAYAAFEKLDIGTDQLIVDARQANVGGPIPTASLLIKDDNGGWVKDMYRPGGSRQTPDNDGRDSAWYLRHNEEEVAGAEETLKNTWDVGSLDDYSYLDFTGMKRIIEEIHDGEIAEEGYEAIQVANDDILIGYEGGGIENNGEGEVGYTLDASQQVSETLRPENINANPQEVGTQARDLVVGANKFFYNNVEGVEDTYMEIDYDRDQFAFDTVGEERIEELERAPFAEYS